MEFKNKNSNRQGFMNHVETIRHIEADKDTFLRAARLERHESKAQPLTSKAKIAIFAMFAIALVFVGILALGYLSGHFVPALVAVGAISFVGIMIGAAVCI